MAKNTFDGLLAEFLPFAGFFLLRNEGGTMELRGDDFAVKDSGEWITIYHRGASAGSESRSHLHLRKGIYRYARVIEKEGATASLGFFEDRARGSGDRPPFAAHFAPFYDWARDRAPLPGNQERFRAFVALHGREFDL